MKKSKTAAAVSTAPDTSNVLTLTEEPGKTKGEQIAELSFSPIVMNAKTASLFSQSTFGAINIRDAIAAVSSKTNKVASGDLSGLEETLVAHAATLDAMFNELAKRAVLNMGTHLQATETYLRMALKAQSQCRTTIETLAEIKHPRQATFIKQANIAQQQQVNNPKFLG